MDSLDGTYVTEQEGVMIQNERNTLATKCVTVYYAQYVCIIQGGFNVPVSVQILSY